MTRRLLVPMIAVSVLAVLAVDLGEAWARARGGFGGRGSRSYSAPVRPTPSPVRPDLSGSPSRSLSRPAAPVGPSRSGLFGGLAGFALGGLLGGLLFGGLGAGFGVGLLDLIILGALVMLGMSLLRRRRQAETPAYAVAGAGYTDTGNGVYGPGHHSGGTGIGGSAAMELPAAVVDRDRGLGHIRQMDPGFDPDGFPEVARRSFVDVQSALVLRDMGRLRNRLTPEVYVELQSQCDRLRAARQSNHVERIEIARADLTEAWQERGQDYVTVCLAGSLLDYVREDGSGAVIEGSATEPQSFEEFWTFTRPVGPGPWKLSAIQTA